MIWLSKPTADSGLFQNAVKRVAAIALGGGGTLTVIAIWALCGLLIALLLYRALFRLPLPRFPNAAGCFMLAGGTTGVLAGLLFGSLAISWLTGN